MTQFLDIIAGFPWSHFFDAVVAICGVYTVWIKRRLPRKDKHLRPTETTDRSKCESG